MRTWLAHAESDHAGNGPSPWQYGGFVDLSYALNFNFPENHQWRSKETTPRTNELAPNMVLGYVHKEPHRAKDWGFELAGDDDA